MIVIWSECVDYVKIVWFWKTQLNYNKNTHIEKCFIEKPYTEKRVIEKWNIEKPYIKKHTQKQHK